MVIIEVNSFESDLSRIKAEWEEQWETGVEMISLSNGRIQEDK